MANLSNLLESKSKASLIETNLDQGEVFLIGGSTNQENNCYYCWLAPADGYVEITAWGAGGSSARMCCCGMGLPGNPGAYMKTARINVTQGQYICGCVGESCGNSSQLCFRGCGNPNMFCVEGEGCACIQAGRGGFSRCQTGTSMLCCFRSCSFCTTQIGSTGCGIVCNYGSSYTFIPCAYTDSLPTTAQCCGGISCMLMLHCNPECRRLFKPIIAIPPGYYSTETSYITYWQDCCCYNSSFNYAGFENAMLSMSRAPSSNSNYDYCWTSGNNCMCYEQTGCIPMMPPGWPGDGSSPCSSVRDHGRRGGHGAIKIRFVRN